jgi:hypothetical protein
LPGVQRKSLLACRGAGLPLQCSLCTTLGGTGVNHFVRSLEKESRETSFGAAGEKVVADNRNALVLHDVRRGGQSIPVRVQNGLVVVLGFITAVGTFAEGCPE